VYYIVLDIVLGFLKAAIYSAIWYGVRAFLVQYGIIATPVALVNWWWFWAAFGSYKALQALSIDLRAQGKFPEFFAFWGPYRTTAGDSGLGWTFAAILLLPHIATEVPINWIVPIGIGLGASYAFLSLSQLANQRHEYPVLAAVDVAFDGSALGIVVAAIGCGAWVKLTQTPYDVDQWPFWLGAALGAAANLWRRFGNTSAFHVVRFPVEVTGRTKSLLIGLWWSLVGVLLPLLAWTFPLEQLRSSGGYNMILVLCIPIGFILVVRRGIGIARLVNALKWSKPSADARDKQMDVSDEERMDFPPRSLPSFLNKNRGRPSISAGNPAKDS
jgi:hypothetical protein